MNNYSKQTLENTSAQIANNITLGNADNRIANTSNIEPHGNIVEMRDAHSDDESGDEKKNGEKIMKSQKSRSINRGFKIKGSTADFDPGTLKSGSLSSNFALPLSWHKLSYKAHKLVILKGLTGTALPSRCLAIMGASGAGKTTFLNAICDRLAQGNGLKLAGRRQLGDVEYQRRYRKALGFVTQDDIISSLSTPVDAFWFALRTRRGTSVAETHERVNETLEILRLVHCKNTTVGIPGLVAGLSGGERKRCSIGVELICDPKVLLLDEPTSGLDSVTSAKIVNLLQQLSRMGRTIIYTIHQPTAEVLTYFDDLMLLTQGKCVYHGTMADSVDYFSSIGFECPTKYTPSDFYMTLLQDNVTSQILIKRWEKFLKNNTRTPHTAAIRLASSHSESSSARYLDQYITKFGSSPLIQFIEITRRRATEITRDKLYVLSSAMQALFFAIVVGLIFLNIRDNVEGMTDRNAVIFMITMNRCMSPAFLMINVFHSVRAVYLREQQAGAYAPVMFHLGRMVAEFPVQLFFVIVESLIIYFMIGLEHNVGAFFYYFGVVMLASMVGTGLGFAISATFSSLVVASAITPLVLVPLSIAGGLFASTSRLRPYWYWLEKPSYIRHSYILLLRNELRFINRIYCNNYKHGDFYCVTQPRNGEDILLQLGFDNDPQSTTPIMWGSLAIMFFLVNIWAVISLSFVAREKTS